MEIVKYLVWAVFVLFVGYTIYCMKQESFFKTLKRVWPFHWVRQLTFDLYIGLFLLFFMVYLHEGSVLVALCWLVPSLFFGNIVSLLYFALHFDAIVSHFLR